MAESPSIFERLRQRFAARKPAVVEGEVVSVDGLPKTKELGLTGTANYSGEVLAESNLKLINDAAYGRAGVREWGFWERMARTDEAFAKSLDFVVAPIRDALVEVEEAQDNPNGGAQADAVRHTFDTIEPGQPEFLAQTTRGSLMSGFALHELVPGMVEHSSLPGGRGWLFVKLGERLPNSIHQNGWIEENGDLVIVRQNGPVGCEWKSIDLPVERLLLNTWNRSGNNYLGFSAWRSCYQTLRVREELSKIIAIAHMRESCGIPIAVAQSKDSPRLSPSERESLLKFMANCTYHENSALIAPHGWDVKWLFAQHANKPLIIEAYNMLGQHIAQQVGAQHLYLGTSDTGSRSVGEVHSAQARAFLNGVVANTEAVLNGVRGRPYTGLVRKTVDLNWGPQTKGYPKVKLVLRKPEIGLKERIEAISLAKRDGLIVVSASDSNMIREELGLELDEQPQKQLAPTAVDPGSAGSHTPGAAGSTPATAIPDKDPMSAAGAPTGPGVPAVAGAVADVKAQDTALNGAQSAEARALLESCAQKNLPPETVKRLLVITLRITEADAGSLVDPLAKFEAPKPPPAMAPGFLPKALTPGEEPMAEEEPGEEKEAAPALKVDAAAAPMPWAPYRPLRESEKVVEFSAINTFLNASREDFERGGKPILVAELTRLLPDVEAAMADGDPSEVAGLAIDTAALETFVGQFLERCRAEGRRQAALEKTRGADRLAEARGEGDAAVRFAAEEEDDKRGDVVDEQVQEAEDHTQQLLTAQRKALTRRMAARLKADIETEAIEVIRTGGDPSEVITRVVQRQIEGGGLKTDGGSVLVKAFNMGREEFARSYGDEVQSVELSCLLDGNQCPTCEQLDGQSFDFGSEEHDRYTPPLRDCDSAAASGGTRCRCILIYRWRANE